LDIYYEIKPGLIKKSALALGFFDGVHPGHQAVIDKAVQEAKRLEAIPCVVTFKDHPRSLTVGKAPPLITLIEDRLALFSKQGIKTALVLSFSEEICRLAPEEYVKDVLVDCMGAKSLSVGYNHRFGRNREGSPELLKELGKTYGFSVHVANEVFVDGVEVSSSLIREALSNGAVELAHKYLSRHYAVTGIVIKGDGRGNKLGFATANLNIKEEQLLPQTGVYAGRARLANGNTLNAVINLGFRPTFGTDNALCMEVHILDFKQDIYGEKLTVEFWHKLRNEQKFDGIESLKKQINLDCESARSYFALQTAMPNNKQSLIT
jgi:riboflavin kinase/FMN adenylyltransferase